MIDIDDEIIIASEVDVVYEYEVFGRSRAGAYIYCEPFTGRGVIVKYGFN